MTRARFSGGTGDGRERDVEPDMDGLALGFAFWVSTAAESSSTECGWYQAEAAESRKDPDALPVLHWRAVPVDDCGPPS